MILVMIHEHNCAYRTTDGSGFCSITKHQLFEMHSGKVIYFLKCILLLFNAFPNA